MDKITITLRDPKVLEILGKLKGGTPRRFVVERAIEMLYNDPKFREVLFNDHDSGSGAPSENMMVENKPITKEEKEVPVQTAEDTAQAAEPDTPPKQPDIPARVVKF